MQPTTLVIGLSDIGRTRTRNEDSIALLPELGAAVVADGMGGHPGGDVASRIAAETAASTLRDSVGGERPAGEAGLQALRDALGECVAAAHNAIRAEAEALPELEGMGTTVTALFLDEDVWVIGHVGDSRAYRLRDGQLQQLTRDDTWVQDRVDAGEFTPDQAERHPFGHILTQCVGLEDAPEVHVYDGAWDPGDVFLLCTDGLIGMLTDDDVVDILGESLAGDLTPEALEAGAGALVARANEAGGYDNITVSLLLRR